VVVIVVGDAIVMFPLFTGVDAASADCSLKMIVDIVVVEISLLRQLLFMIVC
jgi:hypothetical protein